MEKIKKPDHYNFEEVMRALRVFRAKKGMFGKTVLTWRGQEIVHIEQTRSNKPGEPLEL